MRGYHCLAILALAAVCMGPTGCVQRTITITSDPPHAIVWLNDEEIGRTPVTVPFTFYGKYDVRIVHEGQWMSRDEAAQVLDVSGAELKALIEDGHLDTRAIEGEQMVLIRYLPLSTAVRANAPVWDMPGLDLLAEITPGRKRVELDWHFELDKAGPVDEEVLIWHARQMRALVAPRPVPDEDAVEDEAKTETGRHVPAPAPPADAAGDAAPAGPINASPR